jgi:hypothetical protein
MTDSLIPILFSLAAAVAGWHYLFYSQSAHKLATVESASRNILRIRLRRLNGFLMLLLAALFLAGFRTVDPDQPTRAFFVIWLTVFINLILIVILVLIDLRLTWSLRRAATHKP